MKHVSAWLPVLMSFAAMMVLLAAFAANGWVVIREPDEGAAAHLWQLLMAGQVPVIGFYILKWFPRNPKRNIWIVALQVLALVCAAAPVWYFNF